jgi:prepilin-type N-terminal cleavage/methylation domain-containing protein
MSEKNYTSTFNKRNLNYGFTLIEVLIVIVIGIILLGAGFFSLNAFRSSQTVQSEIEQLVAVLRSAQEKSSGQDSDSRWGVYFDVSGARDIYYLYQVDEVLKATDPYDGVPGSILDKKTLKSPLEITMTAPVTSTIVFAKSTGRPDGTTTITLSNGNPDMDGTITISAQGKIDYQ